MIYDIQTNFATGTIYVPDRTETSRYEGKKLQNKEPEQDADAGYNAIIYLHNATDVSCAVWQQVKELNLVFVNLKTCDWNRDFSPWPAKKAFAKGEDFTGGADTYLGQLLNWIPEMESQYGLCAKHRILCGYSLAGLFSLYAACNTTIFDGALSISGSLWYDDWVEYLSTHPVKNRKIQCYCSLGDRESATKNPRMCQVDEATKKTVEILKKQGVDTFFEYNKGNHFCDVERRIGKGLCTITKHMSLC